MEIGQWLHYKWSLFKLNNLCLNSESPIVDPGISLQIEQLYEMKRKKGLPLFLLWLLFGAFGAHRFYLGNWVWAICLILLAFGQGIVNMIISFGSIALLSQGDPSFFLASPLMLCFWALLLLDGLLSIGELKNRNARLKNQLIQQFGHPS